jgi:hypothetical protein
MRKGIVVKSVIEARNSLAVVRRLSGMVAGIATAYDGKRTALAAVGESMIFQQAVTEAYY